MSRKVFASSVLARKRFDDGDLGHFQTTSWIVAHSRDEAVAVKKRNVVEDEDNAVDETWEFSCQAVEIPLDEAMEFVLNDEFFEKNKGYFGHNS